MNRFERRFNGGDIIFREGEPSTSAFVLVSGQVELLKSNNGSTVRLSLLNPGEMFGEMGLVDQSPRSAAARAIGDVVVDVVEKEDFIQAIQQKPDVALSIIGNLSQRLRATNELVAQPMSLTVTSKDSKGGPKPGRRAGRTRTGIWELIRQYFLRPKRTQRTVNILIAPIDGDDTGALGKAVAAAFERFDRVQASVMDDPLTTGDDATLHDLLGVSRRKLTEAGASLLIWGAINDTGTAMHLRFVSHHLDDDFPGLFLPSDRLALPIKPSKEMWDLLAAVVFAAAVPKTLEQRLVIKKNLEEAFEMARKSKQEPPTELSTTDRASIQLCYGNIAALLGYQSSEASWYREAALAYQEGLNGLSASETPLDWATGQRHLGVVRQALGERANDAEILTTAAESIQTAMGTFTREAFPWEWACLQARLGVIRYRLDSLVDDPELLKDAVAAFQLALQVFQKEDTPLRWSDAKNSLGQALQVWGDIARSDELLERAVLACQEALQVRSREFTPVLWAASQNNLGSALFLLGRMTQDTEHLEGAAEAFGKALEVYQAYGYARLSKVTERNMAKAEDQLRARLARRVANVYWEDRPVELDEIGDGALPERPLTQSSERAASVSINPVELTQPASEPQPAPDPESGPALEPANDVTPEPRSDPPLRRLTEIDA